MAFVNGFWQEETIFEKKKTEEKIKLRPSQVNLQFLSGRPAKGTYIVSHSVIIQSIGAEPIQLRGLNKKVYEDCLIKSTKRLDQKYMKLTKYTTTKATFEFDVNKWLKDSLYNVKPSNRVSRFEQVFKLKVSPPEMISYSVSKIHFDKFILNKFMNYMDKNRKSKVWFKNFLSNKMFSKKSRIISLMFDYEYNWQENKFLAKLKPLYIMGLLFAVGNTANKLRGKSYIKFNFDSKVRRKVASYNNGFNGFKNKRYF